MVFKHCAESGREWERVRGMVVILWCCDYENPQPAGKQHATCHKHAKQRLNMQQHQQQQLSGLPYPHRPQWPHRTPRAWSTEAWSVRAMANGNCQFGQRLRINWLIDFSSINSIVSGCCCCCTTVVTAVDPMLSFSFTLSLSLFASPSPSVVVAATDLCAVCPLWALYWPQHFCCHDKLLSCLCVQDSLQPPSPLPAPLPTSKAQSSLHKARIWQAICVYCVAIKICPQETPSAIDLR